MITYKVGLSVEECDKFIEESPYGNLLQGSKWTKVKDNWQSRRIGFYQGDQLVACASLLCKKIINPYKVAYIPRGPVMDYNNQELVYEVFQALKIFGKKKASYLLNVIPQSYLIEAINFK
ncbi:aminoacyltransferase [Streptococcus didelphis]|nr:peptidoglycan bridge formation glycyltransferase FemA/FemB family protein [Streptococcus didelphis]WMB29520.1 aminoacyltransferase [Streptococcus didelphis]